MSMLSKFNESRLQFEDNVFSFLKKISLPLSRLAFFVVFAWFGFLKIIGLSPAEGLVHTLYQQTLWFIPWNAFMFFFGAWEVAIGIIFLFPGKEKLALYLLIPHMITTFGPLVLLPKLCWRGFMVPNLIGQYIIKNVAIISLAIFIAAYAWDSKRKEKRKAEKMKVSSASAVTA